MNTATLTLELTKAKRSIMLPGWVETERLAMLAQRLN